MTEEMVMIQEHFEMGPIITYSRSDATDERATGPQGDARYRVPLALWEEYEKVTERVSEIEGEFSKRHQALPDYFHYGKR